MEKCLHVVGAALGNRKSWILKVEYMFIYIWQNNNIITILHFENHLHGWSLISVQFHKIFTLHTLLFGLIWTPDKNFISFDVQLWLSRTSSISTNFGMLMRKVDTNIWRIKVCMRRDFQGGNLPMDITKYFIQFQNPGGMWKCKD